MQIFSKVKSNLLLVGALALIVSLASFLFSVQSVLALTSNSNNNVAAQVVSLNETDFPVMDFNINVSADSVLAGVAPAAGTAVATTRPAGWTTLKFKDAAGGGAWNAGTDWIGLDTNADGMYNSGYVTRIDCDGSVSGDIESGGALCTLRDPSPGDSLVRVQSTDGLCTDSLTNPTCVYLGGAGGCIDNSDHDGNEIRGTSGCDTNNDILVTSAAGWAYADNDDVNGVYGSGENLFKEWGAMVDKYFETSVDETLVGTAPSSGTAITGTKPTDWTTVNFNDAVSNGGAWSVSADWIGLDVDVNGYYLDQLTALTADLAEVSTINALTDTTNVKFWLDNGDNVFSTGNDTLLGTALTASAYDSGGSGWYLSGLSRSLVGGANRFFVSMTINGVAGNNELIKVTTPQYVDSDNDKVFDVGDRGMFLSSRVLGNVTNIYSMTVDAIPPTVAITMDDYNLKKNETATVTFTFSEPVTGFTLAADATAQGGVLSNLATSDNTTFTATFTPTNNSLSLTNVIGVNKAGVSDIPGNPGSGTTNSSNYKIDTILPTLTSAIFTDNGLLIGESSVVTFIFSEAVTDFTNADVSVVNGTLTTISGSGTTYTATFSPTSEIENLTNALTIDMAGVRDANLTGDYNVGTGSTNSSNYGIDTVRPALTSVTIADTHLRVGETSLVTFVFSEAVTGFTKDDVTVPANASLSVVSGSGTTYTATLTPDNGVASDLENVLTVNLAGVNDIKFAPGNTGSGTTNSGNYEIDTVRPTLSSVTIADTHLKVGDTSLVTFVFSEAVTGFTKDDVTVPANASLSVVSGSGTTYTATLTPDNGVASDLVNVLTVALTGVLDANLTGDAGDHNAGTGTTDSSNYEIDTVRPTLASAIFTIDGLLIGSTSTVTFTFSENVTGFTKTDVSVPNGTLSTVSGSGTTYTATFTPNNEVTDLENVLTIDLTGVNDARLTGDSNAGTGTADSSNYAIDTVRPTLEITLDDDSLIIDDTAQVTFTFSEAVTGFNIAADASAQNGVLSGQSSSDNIVYTATLTPNSGVEDLTNIVSVAMAGVNDIKIAAGNTGSGTTTSTNYAIDTVTSTYAIQYYSDNALTHTIAGGSYLKAGTYYIKVTASEAQATAPTVTIAAEGTANDVTDGETTLVSGNNYKYTRVISGDVAAIGNTLENISVTGTDVAGNSSTAVDPTNEATKVIYTDTVAPVVDAGTDAGSVSAGFTQDATATDTDGSGIASYSWSKVSGYYAISFGSAAAVDTTVNVNGGGPYTIRLTVVDVAGNSASDDATFTWGTVPGSSHIIPAPSVGGGSRDSGLSATTIGTTVSVGEITNTGVNVLTYISNQNNFTAPVSGQNWQSGSHSLKITNLDLAKNIATIVFSSDPITVTLTKGETKYVDLDGDKINDVSATFSNVYVNRAEITVKSLHSDPVTVTASATDPTIDSGAVCPSSLFTRDLKLKASGNDVKALQQYLNGNGFIVAVSGAGSAGKESNYFGAATGNVLKRFQQASGLKATGIFDKATRTYLGCVKAVTVVTPVVKPVVAAKFTRNLKVGMSGNDVKALQQYLNNNGYIIAASGTGSKGKESTYFGKATQSALIKFQQASGLTPAAGIFDAATRLVVGQ